MGARSKILWTDATWNPMTGCTKVSEACEDCYAEKMSHRFAGRVGYPKDKPFSVTLHPGRMTRPCEWKKPKKVFVCSMGDLFHKDVPDEFIAEVLHVAAQNKRHTFQVLTKRIERAAEFFDGSKLADNLWIGTTVENQRWADHRIPYLCEIDTTVRFISVEPALSEVDIDPWLAKIGWVICGGESGSQARPMHPSWPRKLLSQCSRESVPFLFKQWGEWVSREDYCGRNIEGQASTHHRWEDGRVSYRVGKYKAGRLIDGRVWESYPVTE
jgi:protein gp37